jgi:hypothetical protein
VPEILLVVEVVEVAMEIAEVEIILTNPLNLLLGWSILLIQIPHLMQQQVSSNIFVGCVSLKVPTKMGLKWISFTKLSRNLTTRIACAS